MKVALYTAITLICCIPVFAHAQDAGIDTRTDVLWEAVDSHTPPFYKGKALPSDEGYIRAVAISNSFNPKTTTYTWTRSGKTVPKASGLGKNFFMFKHDIFTNIESVGVGLRAGGNISDSSASTSIVPATPSIVVYEKRDGFIDYNHGYTTNFDLKYAGTTLRVEPFFFSIPKNPLNDLSISFSLGGDIPDTQRVLEIPIIKPDSGGTSLLKSVIQSKNSNWQSASLTTQINF